MNDEQMKKILDEMRNIRNEVRDVKRKQETLEMEFTKGRSKQFDKAIEYIFANNFVSRFELTGKFQTLKSGAYMDKFKEYIKSSSIECVGLPVKGTPEIFFSIGDNQTIKKFMTRFKTEGVLHHCVRSNGFTTEEWREVQEFCNKTLKPVMDRARRRMYMDMSMISWRR